MLGAYNVRIRGILAEGGGTDERGQWPEKRVCGKVCMCGPTIVRESCSDCVRSTYILANNAAAEFNKPLEAIDAGDFVNVFDLNVRAPSLPTQAVLPTYLQWVPEPDPPISQCTVRVKLLLRI
jgi:NAD(P)-dependent dehydrogenase (short-subunit alcohol dehydrogenase family)